MFKKLFYVLIFCIFTSCKEDTNIPDNIAQETINTPITSKTDDNFDNDKEDNYNEIIPRKDIIIEKEMDGNIIKLKNAPESIDDNLSFEILGYYECDFIDTNNDVNYEYHQIKEVIDNTALIYLHDGGFSGHHHIEGMAGINLDTFEEIWRVDLSHEGHTYYANDEHIFIISSYEIICLEIISGKVQWEVNVNDIIDIADIINLNTHRINLIFENEDKFVIIYNKSDNESYLFEININTGKLNQSKKIDLNKNEKLLWINDSIFCHDSEKEILYKKNLETFEVEWQEENIQMFSVDYFNYDLTYKKEENIYFLKDRKPNIFDAKNLNFKKINLEYLPINENEILISSNSQYKAVYYSDNTISLYDNKENMLWSTDLNPYLDDLATKTINNNSNYKNLASIYIRSIMILNNTIIIKANPGIIEINLEDGNVLSNYYSESFDNTVFYNNLGDFQFYIKLYDSSLHLFGFTDNRIKFHPEKKIMTIPLHNKIVFIRLGSDNLEKILSQF